MNQEITQIDAKGEILGRLATKISTIIRSKDDPKFTYNNFINKKIIIYNADKIIVTGNKEKNKKYYKHTGYIGNLKEQTYEELFKKNPSEVLKKAVKNMLPKNRLQSKWIKNIKIYNGEIND